MPWPELDQMPTITLSQYCKTYFVRLLLKCKQSNNEEKKDGKEKKLKKVVTGG